MWFFFIFCAGRRRTSRTLPSFLRRVLLSVLRKFALLQFSFGKKSALLAFSCLIALQSLYLLFSGEFSFSSCRRFACHFSTIFVVRRASDLSRVFLFPRLLLGALLRFWSSFPFRHHLLSDSVVLWRVYLPRPAGHQPCSVWGGGAGLYGGAA